eukprot:522437-Rhodomonas_salina.1
MEIRARAADLLTSIPALSLPPLSFGTDQSGITRLAQTISRVSLKLKGIAGREAKQGYLKSYTFSSKGKVMFTDPDPPLASNRSSDGIEGVDWHR